MFYLLHGDDDYSRNAWLAALWRKIGAADLLALNTVRLDGRQLETAQLQSACSAMPFLAPRRVVIVVDLLTAGATRPIVKQLPAYLPALPPTTLLILIETQKVRETNPVYKWAAAADDKTAHVRLFARPEGPALEKWVRDAVKQRGGSIHGQAAQLLAANVGNDLYALTNEIEKLTLYKGAAEIGPADVEQLSPYIAASGIFELVDALGSRNGRVAARLLQAALDQGVDPFYLFSMFIRQIRLLVQARECLDDRMAPAQIATALGVHPFVAGKLARQAQGFTQSQLEQLYAHLLAVDVGVKTGRAELTTALHLLIADLTETD